MEAGHSNTVSNQASCSRCKVPMRLLDSGSLGQSQFDMLSSLAGELQHQHASSSSASGNSNNNRDRANSPLSRLPPSVQSAYTHPARALSPQPMIQKSNYAKSDKSPASSFIVLSQSQTSSDPHHPSSGPSPAELKLARSAALYNMLNTASTIDHPLCVECADALQDAMNNQLEAVKAERQRYLAFEKDVIAHEKADPQEIERLQKQLEALTKDEETALQTLREAEEEHTQLEAELAALEREEAELQAEEEQFWVEQSALLLQQQQAESHAASIRTQLEHDQGELDKLRKANVYNDAFCIGHDGGLATINGLRLGRLPDVPVEWSEINAAWGHALLLLSTIARKWEYTFERWRLIPKASMSKVERLSDGTAFELYASGDWLALHRRFNAAQVGFLDCLDQLMSVAKRRDAAAVATSTSPSAGQITASADETVKFHHEIQKDKIGNVSIKLGLGNGTDETWTRALRHVLLSLKILLSRVEGPA